MSECDKLFKLKESLRALFFAFPKILPTGKPYRTPRKYCQRPRRPASLVDPWMICNPLEFLDTLRRIPAGSFRPSVRANPGNFQTLRPTRPRLFGSGRKPKKPAGQSFPQPFQLFPNPKTLLYIII